MARALQSGLRDGGLNRGGLHAGIGNGSIFTIASLDLNFAKYKNIGSLVTFTRASSGTFVGSDGVSRTAATNEPRFDHNPITGESLGLLVEEARTNLLTYSEDVSQWATPFNATLAANSIAAPDGALTADRLLETTATNLHACDSTAITFVTSTVYTYSVFVNSIGGRNFEIAFPVTLFTARFAQFTLSGTGAVQGADSGVTASIRALANGWYRCSASSTCVLGAGSRMGNFINDASNSRSYTGDITKGIYIWGAQLEAGAFPTSYIPTTTAAATRSADVASITGSNFSSWYNQTEGTVFADFRLNGIAAQNKVVNVDAGAGFANSVDIYCISGIPRFDVWESSTAQAQLSPLPSSSIGVNTDSKTTGAYKLNDFAATRTGGTLLTDTSGIIPTTSRLIIGNQSASNYLNGTLKRLVYFPQRLSNNTLQAITQP